MCRAPEYRRSGYGNWRRSGRFYSHRRFALAQVQSYVIDLLSQPASHVGIVGLKPTFGLVPYTGIISSETSVDHTGPMTRDVFSNAQLLRVIAGVDGMDDRQLAGTPFREQVPHYDELLAAARTARALLSTVGGSGVSPGDTRKVRIGVLKEGETSQVMDPRVVACVRAAAKRFQELGAEVIEVSVPGHTQAPLIGRAFRFAPRLMSKATY